MPGEARVETDTLTELRGSLFLSDEYGQAYFQPWNWKPNQIKFKKNNSNVYFFVIMQKIDGKGMNLWELIKVS